MIFVGLQKFDEKSKNWNRSCISHIRLHLQISEHLQLLYFALVQNPHIAIEWMSGLESHNALALFPVVDQLDWQVVLTGWVRGWYHPLLVGGCFLELLVERWRLGQLVLGLCVFYSVHLCPLLFVTLQLLTLRSNIFMIVLILRKPLIIKTRVVHKTMLFPTLLHPHHIWTLTRLIKLLLRRRQLLPHRR